jgi:hypothetical protein
MNLRFFFALLPVLLAPHAPFVNGREPVQDPRHAAPSVVPPPAGRAGHGIECSVRAFERGGEWHCEVKLVNNSREVVVVPRGARSVWWADVVPRVMAEPPRLLPDGGTEHSFRVRGRRGRSVNHVGKVRLVPDEGYVRNYAIGKLEPGEYRLTADLPRDFEKWNPRPVKFTVPDPATTLPAPE